MEPCPILNRRKEAQEDQDSRVKTPGSRGETSTACFNVETLIISQSSPSKRTPQNLPWAFFWRSNRSGFRTSQRSFSADFYLAEFGRCWSWSLSPCCRGVPPWRLAVSYASGTSYPIRMRVVEELWQVARRYSTWLYLYNCIKVIVKGCLMSILNVIIRVFDFVWLCNWLYEMMDPWGQSLVFLSGRNAAKTPMPSQTSSRGDCLLTMSCGTCVGPMRVFQAKCMKQWNRCPVTCFNSNLFQQMPSGSLAFQNYQDSGWLPPA